MRETKRRPAWDKADPVPTNVNTLRSLIAGRGTKQAYVAYLCGLGVQEFYNRMFFSGGALCGRRGFSLANKSDIARALHMTEEENAAVFGTNKDAEGRETLHADETNVPPCVRAEWSLRQEEAKKAGYLGWVARTSVTWKERKCRN